METTQVYGVKPLLEALKADQNIEKIYVQKNTQGEGIKEIISLSQTKNIQVSYVPIEKLNKLSKNENHQGVFARLSPIGYISIEELLEAILKEKENPFFLILDELTDVRNVGAIIRTAESTGVDGIIMLKHGGASINEQTVKTSTGAIFNIPICKIDHIKDALFYMDSYNIQTLAASEKTDKLIYEIDLKQPTALIMGSEGKGVSKSALKMAKVKAKLPMLGETSSLNVSVACGVILYEMVRQRLI
ncbi:23S rRNA (guanosine(2251)-2'-O)-methyltransferase RlmB [Mesonia aestuariivivens]|uniref:23S rRNA (Guanosine(2251)-2'-O)-methyltransferase RlmB n=1 Tax=Mesonia aestuariivivens TaxID=2796128 RepID=A0ABS6W303_9FLAO|nr:23S rRNA (guanosine(2251)-2'-O)-methyltransferase RlmB [Mesonia aestuariivivens]MBW2962228.1 23S rRNA (guanosine(2251)-2'-O)-methyltransferase RlmB [Mesonia aestuariivivens]